MSRLENLFRLSVFTAAVGIAGGAIAQEPPRVHFYNWNDYIADDTLPKFTQETGISVTYDVYDSNEVLEARLFAGNSGFDVVVPTSTHIARHINAGIYLEIDRSKIPNYDTLDPTIMRLIEAVDPGNKFGVPYMWGTTGVGYNVDKIREIFGDDAPTDSWDLVLQPENIAKLASCGVAFLDAPTEIFPTVLNYLGMDPSSTNPRDYSGPALEHLMKLRPHITYFHSSRFITELANGDICAVVGWSGDILQARDRAEEAGNNVNIAYYIPKEGAHLWVDIMAIPKDARHPDNAHKLISYLLAPENMAGITNYVAYANPVPASKAFVDESILEDVGIYPSDEVMEKLFTVGDLPQNVHREMTRAWTRVRTGR
ncbi:extracellular solute-binding protein [Azoarcus taiwanensis]|uniref:Putrescine-binding periplasmic protein n=1 Tax=Azoarcus taiwanensis TaxID=666964 RepID=A0A972FHJ8_9RHOO|nr:extracellular solute-binding protein [Azoarcus taiwanensis]NMG04860.1 extracellular solute-binding protein [Azoarcus taiwanensis]